MEQLIDLIRKQKYLKKNIKDSNVLIQGENKQHDSDDSLQSWIEKNKLIKQKIDDDCSSLEQLIVFHYYYERDIMIERHRLDGLIVKLHSCSFKFKLINNYLFDQFTIVQVDWN